MEVKMNMPDPPEGYEYTREYRKAKPHEPRLGDGEAIQIDRETTGMYPILRKKKKTRPPVPGDIKDAPILCSVSMDGFTWNYAYLAAVLPWMDNKYLAHNDYTLATTRPWLYMPYKYCTIEVDE